MLGHLLFGLVVLPTIPVIAAGQDKPESAFSESPYFARTNTFGILAEYSNDSSHMLLGDAENRKLLSFGVSYSRKLFLNGVMSWQYDGELLPVAIESDPIIHYVNMQTSPQSTIFVSDTRGVFACQSASGTYDTSITVNGVAVTYAGSYAQTCRRQWTIGEAMSPIGFQWNFLPRRKLQPFFVGHGGYMYSTRPIPIDYAGSFNFIFDFGPGIELYRSHTRSLRAGYRYHHISNHNTANENPGVDNSVFQITYAFGR